jgi:hypothetical protein
MTLPTTTTTSSLPSQILEHLYNYKPQCIQRADRCSVSALCFTSPPVCSSSSNFSFQRFGSSLSSSIGHEIFSVESVKPDGGMYHLKL